MSRELIGKNGEIVGSKRYFKKCNADDYMQLLLDDPSGYDYAASMRRIMVPAHWSSRQKNYAKKHTPDPKGSFKKSLEAILKVIKYDVEHGIRQNDYMQDQNADALREALKNLDRCKISGANSVLRKIDQLCWYVGGDPNDIKKLQECLNKLNILGKKYGKIKEDGIYGVETATAWSILCDKLLDDTNDSIKTLQSLLANIDGTFSQEISASISPGIWGFSGYLGIAADAKGNIGLQYGNSGGIATTDKPGFSIIKTRSVSNASSIEYLLGSGYQIGGSITSGVKYGLYLGCDINLIPTGADEKYYWGGSLAAGLSTTGVEMHCGWGEAFPISYLTFNLFKEWDRLYQKLKKRSKK